MEKLTGLDLLKAAKNIRTEIDLIEREIREETARMQGMSSMKFDDMPRSRKMPEGMDRALAKKDELEREQRNSVADLYEMLGETERILQKEGDPELRLIMRVMYVENRPAKDAQRLLHMSMSTLDRLKRKVKLKYGTKDE